MKLGDVIDLPKGAKGAVIELYPIRAIVQVIATHPRFDHKKIGDRTLVRLEDYE